MGGEGAAPPPTAVFAQLQGLPPGSEAAATRQLRDASAAVLSFMRALLARKVEADFGVLEAEAGSAV